MVNVELLLEYSRVFPNQHQTMGELSEGISKNLILQAATTFLNSDIQYKSWEEVLNIWLSDGNQEFLNQLVLRLREEYIRKGQIPKIINPFASLKLLQMGLSMRENQLGGKDKLEIEIDIFKIYLLINEAYASIQLASDEYLQMNYPEIRIATLLLEMGFSASELNNFSFENEAYSQFVKSLIFFNFAKDRPELEEHNRRFLEDYGLNRFVDYQAKTLPLLSKFKNKPVDGFIELTPDQNERFEENKRFLKQLSTQLYSVEDDIDFKVVRSFPLIQVAEDVYRVSHPLFFIDKIYKCLFFEYSRFNGLVNTKLHPFRSYYTTNFSEKFLLYKVIEYCFGQRYIQYNGAELEAMGFAGAPDFYIRNGKHIFLFENKDVLINAQVKENSLFEPLERELKKKFLEKDGKPIGIGQLVQNIKKVLLQSNTFDRNYNSKNVVIYPLLVVHDIVFDCPGLNTLFNVWFKKELSKLEVEGFSTANVKPLVILRIDSLILAGDLIRKNKLTLKEMLGVYYDKLNTKKKPRDYTELQKLSTEPHLPFSKINDNYLTQKFGSYLKTNNMLDHFFKELI